MFTRIENLLPCTQYSLVIGAGPVNPIQKGEDDTDKEEDKTIDETWIFEDDAFTTVASTSPVSKITKLKFCRKILF